jgi:ABC-type molybdate transport system ATPase subunit
MTTKDDLLHLVDELDEDAVGELLDYAHWLSQPGDTLTGGERTRVEAGKAEIASGDFVTLEELRRKLAL